MSGTSVGRVGSRKLEKTEQAWDKCITVRWEAKVGGNMRGGEFDNLTSLLDGCLDKPSMSGFRTVVGSNGMDIFGRSEVWSTMQ